MDQGVQLLPLFLLSLGLVQFSCGGEPFLGDDNNIDSAIQAPQDPAVTQSLNDTVDFVLDVLQETLIQTNHTVIPIPDIEEQFIKNIHGLKIKGKLIAKKGWCKDLSTVHRTGDATMTQSQSGHNITVAVGVGLGVMELGYDYLQVKVEALRMTGNVTVSVNSNSLLAQVNVVMSEAGKCNVTLQELKITQLDGLRVHIEGLKKPIDWLVSMIVTIITQRAEDKIRLQVEKNLAMAAQQAMDKFHC